MIRIDNATAVGTRPTIAAAGTEGYWTNGDPGLGTPATILEADHLNDLQENLRAIIDAGGVTPTKGPGGDLDLLTAIQAIANGSVPAGTLVGDLYRSSNSVIQLRPRVGTNVFVGIDGVVLSNSGAISFDMASDLEGSESASTAYYLYLRNLAGVLDPQISATAPDLPGGTKPGYKSGDSTRRCVGSVWNNASSNFALQTWLPGGEVLFRSHDADFEPTVGLTGSGWQSRTLNLPLCASAVRILVAADAGSPAGSLVYGASDASTNPTSDFNITGANAGEILLALREDAATTAELTAEGTLPIADPSAPAVKWSSFGVALSKHQLVVKGYHDLFAPR